MIHIAVCDDEPVLLHQIRHLVADFFRQRNLEAAVAEFTRGEELLQYGGPIDILFLDIRMQGMDGMKTARRLRESGFQGELIFVTVLKELVFDSFGVQPFDYLVKPVEKEKLEGTLQRLLSTQQDSKGQNLLIRQGSDIRIVPLAELVFCEVIDRKVFLHLKSGEVIDYYERIASLEEQLGEGFFRCHRSYLIHLRYLRGYKNGLAVMEGGPEIPVSRLRNKEFTSVILQYMKKWRE